MVDVATGHEEQRGHDGDHTHTKSTVLVVFSSRQKFFLRARTTASCTSMFSPSCW